MEDAQAVELLERLTEYGVDYPDEAVDGLTVALLVDDLTNSIGDSPGDDALVLEANRVWGSVTP
jgi:hypothetical protein